MRFPYVFHHIRYVPLFLFMGAVSATEQDFMLVIDVLDVENRETAFQDVEIGIDNATLHPKLSANRMIISGLSARRETEICVNATLADGRRSEPNCRKLTYTPENDPEQDNRYNFIALLDFLTEEQLIKSLPECCDSRVNEIAGNYHLNTIPQGEQRIIFSRFSLKEGSLADQSLKVVLNETDPVLIVTQKSNGESFILRDEEAIAVMRERNFIKADSWELTPAGWLGYEMEDSD